MSTREHLPFGNHLNLVSASKEEALTKKQRGGSELKRPVSLKTAVQLLRQYYQEKYSLDFIYFTDESFLSMRNERFEEFINSYEKKSNYYKFEGKDEDMFYQTSKKCPTSKFILNHGSLPEQLNHFDGLDYYKTYICCLLKHLLLLAGLYLK